MHIAVKILACVVLAGGFLLVYAVGPKVYYFGCEETVPAEEYVVT